MSTKVDISGIVASIANEKEAQSTKRKTLGLTKTASRLKGEFLDSEAVELKKVAEEIAGEIGIEALPMSQQLEKVASEMEAAESTEEIIKIAQSLGNSDLAYISKIASSLADAIHEDLSNRLEHK